jgi:hypothetical protein
MRNADLHHMISCRNGTGLSLERPAIIAHCSIVIVSENTSIVTRVK